MKTNEKNEQHWRELVLRLSQIAAEKNITHQAIADELGMNRSNVSRFFAGNQCPTLRTFVAVARAVGVNVKCLCSWGIETTALSK